MSAATGFGNMAAEEASRKGKGSGGGKSRAAEAAADLQLDGDAAVSEAIRMQIPPFLRKLMAMINNPATDALISWSQVRSRKHALTVA